MDCETESIFHASPLSRSSTVAHTRLPQLCNFAAPSGAGPRQRALTETKQLIWKARALHDPERLGLRWKRILVLALLFNNSGGET
jgi:hypothetical protein